MGSATSPAPLAGLRVLDFGHTIMGPCAGLLLADLGADVVKVEPPGGDATRHLPGFAAGFFATYNRNKRSIAIDLKRAEGQTVLRRLAASADILLENFAPGTIERLGCGWADLEKVNPRLIYLAMKGFLAGPYEGRGALDEVVQMQTGLAYMTGPPGRPLRMGAPIIDILGAVFGVVAVLAALRERDRTGGGVGYDFSTLRPHGTRAARRQLAVRERRLPGRIAYRRQRRDRRADAADARQGRRLGRLRRVQRQRRRPGVRQRDRQRPVAAVLRGVRAAGPGRGRAAGKQRQPMRRAPLAHSRSRRKAGAVFQGRHPGAVRGRQGAVRPRCSP
jgi:hypothetical protein